MREWLTADGTTGNGREVAIKAGISERNRMITVRVFMNVSEVGVGCPISG